jgi:hypothetical protein
VIGRAYKYLLSEKTEEKMDPNPVAWARVYVDSNKLLFLIKEVLAERRERQGTFLCC